MNFREKIIDIWWWIKDQRIAQKITDNPEVYFIYLPSDHKKTFIDFYIKAGALTENKEEMGLGHLLEHYLSRVLKSKYFNQFEVDGIINDDYLFFTLKVDRKQKEKAFINFIDEIIIPNFIDEKIFISEKQAIENELMAEKQNLEKTFARLIRKTRYIDEPNNRSFVDHLEILPKLKLKNLTDYYQKTFFRKNIKIFISDYQRDRRMEKIVIDRLKFLPDSGQQKDFPAPRYSDTRIIIEEKKEMNGQYVALSFPLGSAFNNYKDRLRISVLIEYLIDGSQEIGFSQAREKGIYSFNCFYNYGIKNGYWGIKSYLTNEQLKLWLEITSKSLNEIKAGNINHQSLEKIKEEGLMDSKRIWRSNNGRFNYISRTILDYGRIINNKETALIIKETTTNHLVKLAENIFDFSKINLIIYGQKPKLSQEEISSVLVFR